MVRCCSVSARRSGVRGQELEKLLTPNPQLLMAFLVVVDLHQLWVVDCGVRIHV